MTVYPPGQTVVGLFGGGELGSVYTHWATRWLLGNWSQGLSPCPRKRFAKVVTFPAVIALLPENLRPLDPSVGGWKLEQTWYAAWSAIRSERPDEQPAPQVRAITPTLARSHPRRSKDAFLTGGSGLARSADCTIAAPQRTSRRNQERREDRPVRATTALATLATRSDEPTASGQSVLAVSGQIRLAAPERSQLAKPKSGDRA
jgi:hypothetical protein